MEVSEEELEDLVEKKVQEQLKEEKQEDSIRGQEQQDKKISRRQILKGLASGAVGLGALSMIGPVSGYRISSSNPLTFYNETGNKNLEVGKKGVLDVNQIGADTDPINSIYADSIEAKASFTDSSGNTVADFAGNNLSVDNNVLNASVGGATTEDLINSPNYHVPFTECAAGGIIKQPVSIEDGETITIYAWGVRDTDGNTPTGLKVEIREPDGTVVQSANTPWQSNNNGIVEWTNDTGSRADVKLAIHNDTGSNYTDPDGIGGQFSYEVSE